MAGIDFDSLLKQGDTLMSFPPFLIEERSTDHFVEYNKERTRLDRIANNVYGDPQKWKLILWANPQYFTEFDIPNNTVIRVPSPLDEVETEVTDKILRGRNIENLQK